MTSNLQNITLSQLFKLEDPSEYEAMLYVQASDTLRKKKATPFEELTFSQVVEIRNGLNGSLEEIAKNFEIVFGIEKELLLKLKVKEFYPAFNHIVKETKRLIEAENALSESDPEWQRAGGEQLSEFREAASLILIAQQFATTPQAVEQWKYGIVYMIMKWNYLHGKVSKAYQRIKSKQS